MSALLELTNVNKFYPGVRALKEVDFSLDAGELHCLVGENGSGKSTLIKIISGVVQPDANARIVVDGEEKTHLTAHDSLRHGIRVIYQDLALFPNLTVKENIAFGLYDDDSSPFVNWKMIRQRAEDAMEIIGLDLDLDQVVGTMSIAEQQLVEIARSLIGELKLLILDEPTASLTRKEVNSLFGAIKRLQQRGIATLFVSHKLNEIFEIAERVTVLRDGEKVGEYAPSDLDHDKLIYLMTGQSMESTPPIASSVEAEHVLDVSGLARHGHYRDIGFYVKRGEILGITGRLGSGRTELALSIFGMNPPDAGDILLEGNRIDMTSNTQAQRLGIAYVPEDRLTQGVVMDQSILDNITLPVLNKLKGAFGLLDDRKRVDLADRWQKSLDIKMDDPHDPVRTLSGGNQQKVVLSKWLATDPKLLILDEPTVGIDVYAKNSVHDFVKNLAKRGISIILISDEIQEVLANCHRVLVMDRGHIVHELVPDENSERELYERFNLA